MQKEHARCIFLHLMEKFREKNIQCFIFFMECRKLIKTGYGADMCRRWLTV